MNDNNPYRSPMQTDRVDETQNDLSNQNGFPWRVFPSAFCWLQGCFGIYGLIDFLLFREHSRIGLTLLSLKTLFFLGSCVSFLIAGKAWWQRDWIAALVWMATAYVIAASSMVFI